MSHCVPDWDETSSGELISCSDADLSFAKVEADRPQRRKSAIAENLHVPIYDSEDLKWVETHLAMQGEEERGGKRGLWEAANGRAGGGRSGDREATVDATTSRRESVPAIEVPLSNLSFQEDEMLSWLQYPLEDTFDRSYCSELFGEPFHAQQPTKETEAQNPQHPQEFTDSTFRGLAPQPVGPSECSPGSIHNKADAAMALGAGRAAGLVPQSGSEAFHKVRTTVQQQQPRVVAHHAIPSQTPPLPASFLSMPPHHLRPSSLNFPHFTHSALAPKPGLQFVASSSDPTNLRSARQPFVVAGKRDFSKAEKSRPPSCAHGKEGLVACESSIAESTATVMAGMGSSAQSSLSPQVRETRQDTSSAMQGWCSRTLPCRHGLDMGKEKLEIGSQLVTSLSSSAITTSEKCTGTLETVDLEMASPSRGSDNSTEKSTKEAVAASSKRKTRPAEDSEYQSEDVEEVAANEKKAATGRPSAMKRSRAAEIHNLSERKRRDKINVRMKALQELIPNANKTDKASMLDEAIEYMKMLQAQLQFMSMRTGMVVPPMMMPPGMQYLPMQQMPALPHMGVGMGMGMGLGMGMGMGMGMGVGMMDASAGSTVVPLPLPGQPLPIHAYHAAGFQPGTSSSVIPKAQGQGSHVDEACNTFPAQQQSQPLHLNMQMNVDTYSAFMQQQQQKQESPSKKAIH